MKAWIPVSIAFALGLAAHAQAACTYPTAPAPPPDGATATKEQMIAANQDFKRYNGDMTAYLDCLKLEMDTPTKDPKKMTADEKKAADDQQKILTQKNNAAYDELQANVNKFNEQLRIYKAKNK